MEKVYLFLIHNNGPASIGIKFRKNPALNQILRKLKTTSWVNQHWCLQIPVDQDSFETLFQLLRGKAEIDYSGINYLLEAGRLRIPAPASVAPQAVSTPAATAASPETAATAATPATAATAASPETAATAATPASRATSVSTAISKTEDLIALQAAPSTEARPFLEATPSPKDLIAPLEDTKAPSSGVSWVRYNKVDTVTSSNRKQYNRFKEQLVLKGFAASTQRTYSQEFLAFIQHAGKREVASFTDIDLRDYLFWASTELRLKANTLHSRLNALKFYFEQVLGKEKFFWEIPRPVKPTILPKVLSEFEIQRLFAAIGNIKHKAILFTAYSAGLRVSEVVQLRLQDIDSGRMQIFISQSKGKKDRYVGLSPLLLEVLRTYLLEHQPRPNVYLFEGEKPGEPYSARSAQEIFQFAKRKAGISKPITFHSLRHSFATHLLEKGIDIHFIKQLLGHNDLKTTERYLHVKRQDLVKIVNPLDSIFQGSSWREPNKKK